MEIQSKLGKMKMTVLAHSLDGCLRIHRQSKHSAVIELRSHLYPGDWIYCVWRTIPIDEAWEMFYNQCQYHLERKSNAKETCWTYYEGIKLAC